MCIQKKIAEIQEQIDAKLKFKSLLEKTQPLLTSISVICADYRELAPEELPFLMGEILQAAQINLFVAAISAIAATGDEKAQKFAADAMAEAIEQRISAAFQVSVQSVIDSLPDAPLTGEEYDAAVEKELAVDDDEPTDLQKLLIGNSNFTFEDLGVSVSVQSVFTEVEVEGEGDAFENGEDDPATEKVEEALFTCCNAEGVTKEYYCNAQYLVRYCKTSASMRIKVEDYAQQFLQDLIPELGGNWAEDITNAREVVPPEEPTKLQKLLEGTNLFVFDKLGAKVRVDSEFIENNHGEEPEVTEEALFTVTDRDGGKVQHYYHSAEDLIQWKPIAGWNPLGNLMNTAEAYAKKWVKEQSLEVEPSDLIEQFSITNLPLPHLGMRARVTPATGDGKFAGATFTFYRVGGTKELFNTAQTADEIAKFELNNNPDLIASALAESWARQEELKNVPPAGTTHTEPPVKDEFTELVYLSDAVAYVKRKDTGEILSGYLGFSNKTAEGDRAPTMAKSRAVKWQEHLMGVYQLACCGPRECQRIESKNPKQPFKYELKIVKPSMGQLQGLTTENFGLYPNEVEEKQEGSEARRELLVPPAETDLADFDFEKVADFDDLNPEFLVKYKEEYLTRIWSSLRTTAGQQPQRFWRHKLLKPGEEIELKDREAAALHALQRTRGLA